MKYILIRDDKLEHLEVLVNDAIEIGWKPQGGIAISHAAIKNEREGWREIDKEYVQAMAREFP